VNLTGEAVLVTGANGFVGTRVARRLAAEGAEVRAMVRRPGERKELQLDGIEEITGDFGDADDARAATEGARCVVHCAATLGKDLADARRVNVEGTRTILAAAADAEVHRFAHVSSVSVYELADRERVDEDCPYATEGHQYGVSKAEGDRLVLDLAQRGFPAFVLRPGAILGVHPTSSWAVKVPARVRDGEQSLLGDGGNLLPLLHVEDLVDAVLLGLSDERALGRAYNVVDHHETWKAFTDRIRGWFGSPPLPVVPAEKAERGAYWTGHIVADRIRDELGYRPRRTYDDGMREAEEYWRSAGLRSRTP
jgi:nucleoside-diphosphate-sugar epimerase